MPISASAKFSQNLFLSLLVSVSIACTQPMINSTASESTAGAETPVLGSQATNALQQLRLRSNDYGIDTKQFGFTLVSESVDDAGRVHHRWQSTIDDTPIWSFILTTHLDSNGVLYLVEGKLPDLSVPIKSDSKIDEESAKLSAITAMKSNGNIWQAEQGRQVYFFVNNSLELAFQVTLTKGFERKFAFISASTGTLLHSVSGSPQ